jgi:hypothetical protein
MSYSISTLLTRNLQDVFGENDPRVGVRPSTRSSLKIALSTIPPKVSTVAVTRSIASRARSGILSGLSIPADVRAGGIGQWRAAQMGYRDAPVSRQLTLGLISSSPGRAGLPPFISFSTSYPELPPRC